MFYLLNLDLTDWDEPVMVNKVFSSEDDIRLFLIDKEILEESDVSELITQKRLVFDKRCAFYIGSV